MQIINNPTDSDNSTMFCNSLEKAKLYNFNNTQVIFMQFVSYPCTGLGCSVQDYLIYNVNTKTLSLFSSLRASNVELYKFSKDKEIGYISSEFKGDPQGSTQMHFVKKLFLMNKKGEFYTKKDKNDEPYYFETITYPNDTFKDIDYNFNWF
ncbi:MAG: hypothetical protein ACRCVT_07470 [Leadbetterella sp.]